MAFSRSIRQIPLGPALILAAACTTDRQRSPVCGMSLVIGPNLIQEQVSNTRALLTEAPRGLPATLPARVAGQADTARATVDVAQGQLVLTYEGARIQGKVTDSTVYGLLVVDDSTSRAMGLLVYEGYAPPKDFPRIGAVVAGTTTFPLLGVRVNWARMSDPRCPLLGPPAQQ